MKLSSIKTKAQFYEFADVWYQRAHNLRVIWQDDTQELDRREKAHRLWAIMTKRVIILSQVALRFQVISKSNKL